MTNVLHAGQQASLSPKPDECNSGKRSIHDRPLRVCFMIDELRTGGTETQLLRMIDAFDRAHVVPHLCLLNGLNDSSRRLEPTNCPIVRLGVRKLIGFHSIRQTWALRKVLRQWNIDVVQVHFPDSTYFGVPVARWAGVSRIVRTRRDLFYWVTGVHKRWGRKLDELYNRRFVDLMIVNSHAVAEAARQQESPPPRRIEVIPNGLDLSQPPPSDAASHRRSTTSIGIVSMLRPEKRLDLFIEAARRLLDQKRDVTFEIAGDGPERARLEALVSRYNLHKHVRFRGVMDRVREFLGTINVGVLCSDTEGLSNAIVEYMAAGLPIVATAVGGNLELLEDGATALLCPAGDADALARGIARALDEPEMARRLGAEARRRCEAKFDLKLVVDRYEQLYRELCLASSQ